MTIKELKTDIQNQAGERDVAYWLNTIELAYTIGKVDLLREIGRF